MNFLAHLALSYNDNDIMIGNFIADFVKGKKALENYAISIQNGIALHRKIDTFTDKHSITQALVELLRPQAQRYASVVIDIVYDHFLAKHFFHFFNEKVENFAGNTYKTLFQNFDVLPPKLQEMLPYMQKENWLVRYGDGEDENFYGLRRSLEGLQRRSNYANNLVLCIDIVRENYEEFDQKSLIFLAEIQNFVKEIIFGGDNKNEF